MKLLVFNCGSSSLKYRLLEMPDERELAGGEAQRVGPPTAEPARIVWRAGQRQATDFVEMPDHVAAFEQVMALLERDGLLPDAIGHRVVHGGGQFERHCRIDDTTIAALEQTYRLAPIHNPPIVQLIQACRRRYPELPQVAVFDTAYHFSIPDYARTYALSREVRESGGFRKFGFHGISHQYVVGEAARMLGVPMAEFNAVSCHLGSGGASLCAVRAGQSIDNTMGYSPLQGLVMSTRCGDLDPALAMRLLALHEGDFRTVEDLLNKRSGVLGLSHFSADIRDVLDRTHRMESTAWVTADVYLWRIRKYLGAYLAAVGRAHAIIFTDTIGETMPPVRAAVCHGMACFGVKLDEAVNSAIGDLPRDISAPDSRVRILVIATNEELAIARASMAVLTDGTSGPKAGYAA